MAQISQLQPAGRRPPDEKSIRSLRDVLTDVEAGIITAFVFVGVGPECASVDIRTGMTRMDRLTIIGELHEQIHIISQVELEQRQEDGNE